MAPPAIIDERAARNRLEALQVEIPKLERELAELTADLAPLEQSAVAAEAEHQAVLESLWKFRMVNARLEARINGPTRESSAGAVLLLLIILLVMVILVVVAVVWVGALLFTAVNVH